MINKKKTHKVNTFNLLGAAFNALYLGAYFLGKSTRNISAARNAMYLVKNLKKL